MAATKSTPKDAQVMATIIKEMGIQDYEPRVLNQMLELTYRYVTSVIDDAQLLSSHAKKKGIDMDDVKLAIQLQVDKYFTTPPPREILLEIARQKNSTPLPLIKSIAGLRLPPDRYSLTACNYRLKSSAKKIRTVHTVSRLNVTTLQPNQVNKMAPAVNLPNKLGATLAVVTKANAPPTVSIVSRTPPSLPNLVKTVPTPIIKFSDGARNLSPVSTPPTSAAVVSTAASVALTSSQMMMPTVGAINPDVASNKRKREDDADDYDVD